MLGPQKTTWDMQKLHGAMLFLFMGIQCPYTLLITRKPVVHTRLCMAFNFLKQLPKNILLSKSSDISKSTTGILGIFLHNRDRISVSWVSNRVSNRVPERPQ